MKEKLVAASLARHRHERPPAIGLNLPLFPNLDAEMCGVVSSDLATEGMHWECRRAVGDLWRTLPSTGGLYMFVFQSALMFQTATGGHRPSWVLYVGRAGCETNSSTIASRYRSNYAKHLDGDPENLWSDAPTATRDQRLAKYLAIYPLEFWWLEVSDRSKIKVLEDHLIKLLDPLLNTAQKLALRAAAPEPAFKKY